jgi:hypothetical protein
MSWRFFLGRAHVMIEDAGHRDRAMLFRLDGDHQGASPATRSMKWLQEP